MLTKREVLDRVAAGDLEPREAARLLDELERDDDGAGNRQTEPEETAARTGAVRRVRVESELGGVTVVGDAAVATVSATGHHEIVEKGDTVEVHCGPATPGRGFVVLPSRGSGGSGRRSRRADGGRGERPDVMVRMNPSLELELAVAAGKVSVRGITGPIRASVELGSLVIDGFAAPIDLSAAAGSIVARGLLDRGSSHVRCELGTIRLELATGSSATITGRSELGSIVLPGGVRIGGLKALPNEPAGTVTIGGGTAALDLRVAAGKIEVSNDE